MHKSLYILLVAILLVASFALSPLLQQTAVQIYGQNAPSPDPIITSARESGFTTILTDLPVSTPYRGDCVSVYDDTLLSLIAPLYRSDIELFDLVETAATATDTTVYVGPISASCREAFEFSQTYGMYIPSDSAHRFIEKFDDLMTQESLF